MTTALVIASATRNHPVLFLKPVSTGLPQDADDRCVSSNKLILKLIIR